MAALTFPLSLAAFFDLTQVSGGKFFLPDSRQFDVTGGGEILDASLGSRLWNGRLSLVPASHKTQADIEALLELLMEPGSSFLAYDKRNAYPAADPTGTLLGVSVPTLSVVNVNRRLITITGLPVGYVLSRGDMVSFTYSSSPVRYGLHRVVAGIAANGGGNATIEVTPPVRDNFTLSNPVTLIKPVMLAKLIPGGYSPSEGEAGKLSTGVNFTFMQTLRG